MILYTVFQDDQNAVSRYVVGNLNIIGYRCEDGRFPASVSSVTTSNPDSLSSSETAVNPGKTAEKSTCMNELGARNQLVVSISQKRSEQRLYNVV